jgi:hypothetical protein
MRNGILACLAVAAASLLLPSTPSYDPWAWILWGREIVGLDLSTTFGPSWKPFPVLFTTAYALAGDLAPALWLATARAGGLLALVMVYRLTVRLASGSGRRLAGVVAVASMLSVGLFLRLVALGHSEGLLIALVLWAIERHLDGEHAHAFVLGFAAALIRPEVWPFLGIYGLALFRKEAQHRRLVVVLLLLVPALWFLPELWGSGDAFRASARAKAPDPGTVILALNPALATLRGALAEVMRLPVLLAAALAIALATYRNDTRALDLALGAALWAALVVGMTLLGYPGVSRLMLPAAALASVLAGIAVAYLVEIAGGGARSLAVSVLLLALGSVYAASRVGEVANAASVVRFEAEVNRDIATAVAAAGGREPVLDCGRPGTAPLFVPALAWHLRVPISTVAIDPQPPGVMFRVRELPTSPLRPELSSARPRYRPILTVGDLELAATCPRIARENGGQGASG